MIFHQKNRAFKSKNKSKQLAALLSLCLVFLCTACQVSEATDFSYTETSFSLTVTGEIVIPAGENLKTVGICRFETPISFSASVSSEIIPPSDPASVRQHSLTLTYTSPESLQGMTLTFLYHENMTGNENVIVFYPCGSDLLSLQMPYQEVASLLLPVTALFPEGDVISVTPTDNGQKTVTLQSTAQPDVKTSYAFLQGHIYPQSFLYESQSRKIQLFFSKSQ